jgi:hypothetical protein
MPLNPTPPESAVSLGSSETGPKVRNLTVTTWVNGVKTDTLMQVVAISDRFGTPINLDPQADSRNRMLELIWKELQITNALLVQGLNINVDLETEYGSSRENALNNINTLTQY